MLLSKKNGSNYDILKTYGTYNSQHLPSSVTDSAGQVTSYTFTPLGQVQTVTRTRNATNEIVTYNYYPVDLTDGSGNVIRQRKGRLASIDYPLSGSSDVISFDYDAVGRLQSKTDLTGDSTTYQYDNADRIITTTYSDASTETIAYKNLDAEWKKDRDNRWTHMFHDPLRRLTAVTDPHNTTNHYDYCPCGALEDIKDGNGNETQYAYDVEGRVSQKKYADLSHIDYVYESNTSRIKNVTDAKSQVENYVYNIDNTILSISYTDTAGHALVPPTPAVTYTYDTYYSRLTSLTTSGIGLTSYYYYPNQAGTLGAGQPWYQDGPLSGTVDKIVYTYDEYGRCISSSINGVNMSWTFDALGRMDTYSDFEGAFNVAYVGASNLIDHIDYPNTQRVAMTYYGASDNHRLNQILNLGVGSGGSGTMISQFTYSHDPVGNIATWDQQNSSGSDPTRWAIQRDGANEVTDITQTDLTTLAIIAQYRFGYDNAGNRNQLQIGNSIGSANYNNLNQITSVSGQGALTVKGNVSEASTVKINGSPVPVNGSNQFTVTFPSVSPGPTAFSIQAIDTNGNETDKTASLAVTSGLTAVPSITYDYDGNMISDGTHTYEWDAANRLVAINYTGTTNRTEFIYNGAGQRVEQKEKTGNVVTNDVNLIWDGLQLREEIASDDVTLNKEYNQFGVKLLTGASAGNYYYLRDHLGSVREMTDTSGVIHARYNYDAWGHQTKISGDMDADFAYANYYRHAPSQLYLTNYREYSADFSHWLSRDPLGERPNPNVYEYVHNDIIDLVDPLGLVGGAPKGPPCKCLQWDIRWHSESYKTQWDCVKDCVTASGVLGIAGQLIANMTKKSPLGLAFAVVVAGICEGHCNDSVCLKWSN